MCPTAHQSGAVLNANKVLNVNKVNDCVCVLLVIYQICQTFLLFLHTVVHKRTVNVTVNSKLVRIVNISLCF